ncbi:hypothetical protein BGZ95_008698 [Linnemannia exigua]|uniref:Crinkler effector protein N-terminal domain-containing protein n=1 Tax=Linnemannia exigua TaxID=604196 RepID=A0AAD4DDW8_9FUNG|nr:hypothetical protein BGZ95_008698 [Linnemannia exigua]
MDDSNNNSLTLFCLVDGEATTTAFSIKTSSNNTVYDLKNHIKAKKYNDFSGTDANNLTLWCVTVPNDNLSSAIMADTLDDKTKLNNPRTRLSRLFSESPNDNTYILVQQPPPKLDWPVNKKIRIRFAEGWKKYTASDGKVVELPPFWIDSLASAKFDPNPRTAFDHLKNDLRAGDAVNVPSMGQIPKGSGLYGQCRRLFITEQMLELWEDMRGDKERTYKRFLSGPMGVGKSYLSYFLAAKAYAEGWLVLYISDAAVLYGNEPRSALEVIDRFLALNKDILTGAELEMLLNDYNGTHDVSRNAISVIFETLLLSRDRKTLLLVDENRLLFERKSDTPNKFNSLKWLSSYHWWGEKAKGSRVVFTGTVLTKHEMEILDESWEPGLVAFVGPLSKHVFSKLLDTHPRLAAPDIREEVTAITNCVPRELMYLSADIECFPDPVTMDNLRQWEKCRTRNFGVLANRFYKDCTPFRMERFYKALLQMFLGSTSSADFDWDFIDQSLIYRSKDVGKVGTQHHILCRPAQKVLLELFMTFPLHEAIKKRTCDDSLSGDQFKEALYRQLIFINKPIEFDATDLDGKNHTLILLNFQHCDTIQYQQWSLGLGFDNVLARACKGYPRFDFMLGPMLILASVSDFGNHNMGSSDIREAFNVRDDNGVNQIEHYLNDLYGPAHYAEIEDNRFVVTRDGVPVPGFRIVYICGSPGYPAHRDWANKLPDVLHITLEGLLKNLFL